MMNEKQEVERMRMVIFFKHQHRIALPLSITVTKHGFSQLSRLHLQLLNLLQQCFMVGVLCPVPQRQEKHTKSHMNIVLLQKPNFTSQMRGAGLSLHRILETRQRMHMNSQPRFTTGNIM